MYGEKYSTCCRALNATAVALSAVGSYFGKDPMADSATAVALNAILHDMYFSPSSSDLGGFTILNLK